MLVLAFLGGFLLGALILAAIEALGVMFVIKRLNRTTVKQPTSDKQGLDHRQSLHFSYHKEGAVWILESVKIPKDPSLEKVEKKRKKEYIEVSPIRKYAKIMKCSLILMEADGSETSILLKDCMVEAVSATALPSRKWAKRFPIRVESRTGAIYNGERVFYIFLETSWEKESWCKALRLASGDNKDRVQWFTKLQNEFQSYLVSLRAGNLSFKESTSGLNKDSLDQESKPDDSSSKMRLFLKKLTRKTSKGSIENKGAWISGRDARKTSDKLHRNGESVLATTSSKNDSTIKVAKSSPQRNTVSSTPTLPHSGAQSHSPSISNAETDDRLSVDEGSLCLNLLISRLFFDAKSSSDVKRFMKARIQKIVSNMRTPSYIGEVVCTDANPGNLPPYICGMRVCPTDMNEVWAIEVDIEYSGGAVLDVETRVEVCMLDLQKGVVDSTSEPNALTVSPNLLDGSDSAEQLNLSGRTSHAEEQKYESDFSFDIPKGPDKSSLSSTSGSRWKSILNSVAKQVSQVPISLSIRVASLRGTLQIGIKPPPSDQLWFGFTSMPDIELELDSCLGERKITSGQVASFLISKFKAAIQESMVLPNCENLGVSWMSAEMDDWIPRKVAPYMWLNQEALNDHPNATEVFSSLIVGEAKTKIEISTNNPESNDKNATNIDCVEQPPTSHDSHLSSEDGSRSKSLQELKTPLLATSEESREGALVSYQSSRSVASMENQDYNNEEDDSKAKKIGRRARMFDMGKKMGEKLGEKRRNLEEKSRNIVEKMRGP